MVEPKKSIFDLLNEHTPKSQNEFNEESKLKNDENEEDPKIQNELKIEIENEK